MGEVEKFVKFVKLMQPTHVEIKGYSWLGYSRVRLGEENVPEFPEVREFAEELVKVSGYKITNEHEPSKVVQLSSKE